MDKRFIDELEAVLNEHRAEISALKLISQTYFGIQLAARPQKLQDLENWAANSQRGIEDFAPGGDAESVAAMRRHMQAFASDYFADLRDALSKL